MIQITEPVLIFLNNKLDDIIKINGEQALKRYIGFYSDIPSPLKEIFSFFHSGFNNLFDYLNIRIPAGHYTAQESRELLDYIRTIKKIQSNLSSTEVAFNLCTYYKRVIDECIQFLEESGGSPIPPNFNEVNIIEIRPIFEIQNSISVKRNTTAIPFPMKAIGEGSYATVHKYKDPLYNRFFAVKKAHTNLSEAEYKRFHIEFSEMKKLKSPYILEVYTFDDKNRQYIMEYIDDSLYSYISKHNNTLDFAKRNNLIQQIFKAFIYIHSKDVLHRDISPSNILIKKYDGTDIIKVSDFGLVKLEESQLTNQFTEMKGYFNDPQLAVVGFGNYEIRHEIYALTRLIYFIITGRTKIGTFTNDYFQAFFNGGTNPNIEHRYKNVHEMQYAYKQIVTSLQQVNV
ncbi:protein kinase [Bacillus toyonensis]|uniref:protein kinase domain-containing protein n=3 Tax=Bacillus toyonensis TaxID=155322 RepID=UPI002406CEAF|nr:protein kinase [Bacillus toyonensis]MDF9449915.1 protein kinase [Bacillus toyonensis]